MHIRNALEKDIPSLNTLLHQVLDVHANGRPDIFKNGTTKYKDSQLSAILKNSATPIFVAVDAQDNVQGYAFCQYRFIKNDSILHDLKYMYIDDLCVNKTERGKGIGKQLYAYVQEEAKRNECQSIRLNVWALNQNALAFYEKMGLSPLKTTLEYIL